MNCPKCNAEISDDSQFCTYCGEQIKKRDENASVSSPSTAICMQCGATFAEDAKFCTKCGAKREEKEMVQTEPEAAPAPVKRGKILLLSFIILLFVTAFGIGVYDFIKTKEFKETIVSFETAAAEFTSLGKYTENYSMLSEEAANAASHFQFWKYEDLSARMKTLTNEIRDMNESVAEYQEQYEKIVAQIETDNHYIMDDYEEKYQNTKSALEEALSDFDEKKSKKESKALEDIRDEIVEGNEKKAADYVAAAQNIQVSFDDSDAHPFELYMVNNFVSSIEADKAEQDFIKLNDDYLQLKEWTNKFDVAAQSIEQIANFIQADVSENNKVKLYLNSYAYDEYNFNLEDFIIYEKNNNVWTKCKAVDIAQIRGALTMDLVLDVSSSMSGDFYTMQNAVQGFVNSTHSDTELGLSTIGSIYERHQEFTLDKTRITNSVWGLECFGLTSLYQSLYSSVVYTASADGARCVVAFTDGHNEPYGSGYDYDSQDVIDVSNYYQVPIYIIGLGNGVYSNDLKNIAESTGGAYYDRVSVYDLQNIYADIYEAQGRIYELSYETTVPNNIDRDIYLLYADNTAGLSVRLETELNANALWEAYETANYRADDLTTFYTDSKYISSDALSKLGDDLEAVQTIINIYFAKNGYQFGSSENGQKQLAKMISLGVISKNGTLDGDEVSAIIKANSVLYQNYSALYNYRYELIYSAAYNIYWANPSISYEELRSEVHKHFGEENETRFDPVTKAAWNAIRQG